MKRFLFIGVFALIACISSASQSTPKPKVQDIHQRLEQTEKSMAKLAAGHDKTMASLKKIEDRLESLREALHALRQKMEK